MKTSHYDKSEAAGSSMEFVFSPYDLLRAIKAQTRLIVTIVVGIVAITAFLTSLVTPQFEGYAIVTAGSRNMDPVAVAIRAERLRSVHTNEKKQEAVTCSVGEGTGVITIRCLGNSPEEALEGVKRPVADLLSMDKEWQDDKSREELIVIRNIYNVAIQSINSVNNSLSRSVTSGMVDADKRILEMGIVAFHNLNMAQVIEKIVRLDTEIRQMAATQSRVLVEPVVTKEPVRPHWARNIILAVVLGGVLGFGVAFIRVLRQESSSS